MRQFRPEDDPAYPWIERYFHGEDGAEDVAADTDDAPVDAAVLGNPDEFTLVGTNATLSSKLNRPCVIAQFQGFTHDNLPEFNYEFNVLSSYSAGNIGLLKPLTRQYYGQSQIVMADRLSAFTIESGKVLRVKPWGGAVGGLFFRVVNGTWLNLGTLDLKGRGFRGQNGVGDFTVGRVGEGYVDSGGSQVPNFARGNGGGPGGYSTNGPWDQGNGGAGGGNYGLGEDGRGSGGGQNQGGNPGERGHVATDATCKRLFPGGAGGSGGDANGAGDSGASANGGATALVIARTIDSSLGTIDFDGNTGIGSNYHAGAGGSGAAGAGRFIGQNILLPNTVHSNGGLHVPGGGHAPTPGDEDGGYGGQGRMQADYSDSATIFTTDTSFGVFQHELYSDTYGQEAIFSGRKASIQQLQFHKKYRVESI